MSDLGGFASANDFAGKSDVEGHFNQSGVAVDHLRHRFGLSVVWYGSERNGSQ